jgi:hypothetical protein
MSRYPGTQFKVFDNSQVTAIVPIVTANPSDAVQYLSTFASAKGPEGISLSYGENFYDKYGTQDTVDFKKYGQPLLQASMNINNGASILAKRVVLDDATLGNATLGIVVTKFKDAKITVDSDNQNLINKISFEDAEGNEAPFKYSLAPMVFSIENSNNYNNAKQDVVEHKERYDIYKNYITDVVANDDTPNDTFLSKLAATGAKVGVLSGFASSTYYDENDNIIDVVTEGTRRVRTVKTIQTGSDIDSKKTYSSIFTPDDITDADDPIKKREVSKDDTLYDSNAEGATNVGYTVMMYKPEKNTSYKDESEYADADAAAADGYTHGSGTGNQYWEKTTYSKGSWVEYDGDLFKNAKTPKFEEVANNINIDMIFATKANLDNVYDITWDTAEEFANPSHIALIQQQNVGNTWVSTDQPLKIFGYDNTVRFVNDAMIQRSGYIVGEWVFPMFTIFDNGRGKSTKSISIEYDSAVASTMKKAIYKLTVYNYATGKKLESFSFSLNPYERNNSTGYTFDIESAVNYKSSQILVKQYYEQYDALLETLQGILGTNDDSILGTYDIVFGHTINGKYKAFNTYNASALLKKTAYVYDYARLDVFDNDIVTVNAFCDEDNMTDTTDTQIKYYFYNYMRLNNTAKILERLEFGSDGYDLSRRTVGALGSIKVPFVILDATDDSIVSIDYNGVSGNKMIDIIDITGQKNGTIISSETGNLSNIPNLKDINFITANLAMIGTESAAISPISEQSYDPTSPQKIASNSAYLITYTAGSNANEGTWTFEKIGVMPGLKLKSMNNVFYNDNIAITSGYDVSDAMSYAKDHGTAIAFNSAGAQYVLVPIAIPYTIEKIYQVHYARFFNGDFDKDIFNLDVYFPNAIFDANYDNEVKLAIQRLVAYRGDIMAYMDMGIGKVKSYDDVAGIIPSIDGGLDLTSDTAEYAYIRDMHIAVTCLYYKTRNPYNNKVIDVTGTYGLSNLYVYHFKNSPANVFAGISNGITLGDIIRGTVNYIPKIYPTDAMTSLTNIGGVYPSDDSTIINEKQLMCDLKVNYGCYYDDRFSIETEYTMHPADSEFSYWNNVALVCAMMQSIRKACPSARYQFITADDLGIYREAVENAMKPWKNKFAYINFKYVQDDTAIENKIFYAAIEVAFRPFAQAEIFELTALNYSTLSNNVLTI